MKGTVFQEVGRREELRTLLATPLSIYALAEHFHCDRTTIRYHSERMGISRPTIVKRRIDKYKPRKPRVKEGHCLRCEVLLSEAEEGDGEVCGGCLNELGII